jgi:DNA-binding transcriptional LysR family regulator
MDWDKLRIFYCVAEAGSFTRAAARLDITQSAISRQMSGLESRMGVPLFHRHVRGLILTEQGELLLRTVREVFSDLAMAEARLTDKKEGAQGSLAISCTIGFGTTWFVPRLMQFLKKNPEILINVNFSDDPVDVSIRESDVAISSAVMRDESLIYHELIARPLYFYASRKYLLNYGVPIQAEDLDRHQLIAYCDKALLPYDDVNYVLTCGSPPGVMREAYISMNNLYGIAKMVETGSGIGCLPVYLAEKFKDLVQILPDVPAPYVRFYFVYPRQLKNSQRIIKLWEFLQQEVAKDNKQQAELLP